jgi:hypothetical protein
MSVTGKAIPDVLASSFVFVMMSFTETALILAVTILHVELCDADALLVHAVYCCRCNVKFSFFFRALYKIQYSAFLAFLPTFLAPHPVDVLA